MRNPPVIANRMARRVDLPLPDQAFREMLLALAIEVRAGNNQVTMLFDDLATVANLMDDSRDLPGGDYEQALAYRDEALTTLMHELPGCVWEMSPEQADALIGSVDAAAAAARGFVDCAGCNQVVHPGWAEAVEDEGRWYHNEDCHTDACERAGTR